MCISYISEYRAINFIGSMGLSYNDQNKRKKNKRNGRINVYISIAALSILLKPIKKLLNNDNGYLVI